MKVKLGDLCKIYSGGDKPDIVSKTITDECKIPIYGNALENEGLYGYTNFSVIDEKAITISARGSNCGSAFYRDKPYVPIVRLLSLIPNRNIIDPQYLFYIIKNCSFKSTGSGQPQITIPQVSDCEVEIVEDIYLQRRIAKVLADIDMKIKNNNKINNQLELIAKTIYDYWFLQFDFPDENGKPYKSSGGKMVWNEEVKREIPEGWKVSDLSNYIELIRGVAYDTEDVVYEAKEGYIPLLKSNNLQNDRVVFDDIIYVKSEKVSDNQILNNNSVFVTMSSGSTEHVGKTAIVFYNMPYTYGAFCSKIVIKPECRGYISMFFLSDYFKKKIRTIVVGTNIKNINNSHLTGNVIAFPNEKILKKFETTIAPYFAKQGEIIKENQELASLRDFLLPLLMNGQVGFKAN